ncbi:hypothetical protein BDV19DRAFT_291922 [Aspergillus venezuelensis]
MPFPHVSRPFLKRAALAVLALPIDADGGNHVLGRRGPAESTLSRLCGPTATVECLVMIRMATYAREVDIPAAATTVWVLRVWDQAFADIETSLIRIDILEVRTVHLDARIQRSLVGVAVLM